jgi:hypothetical protein
MSDDKNAESSTAESTEVKDKSLESSEADAERSEGEESSQSSGAQARIKQLVQQRKEAEAIVNWYRENIGDPNDVVTFKQWKASQLQKAKEAEEDGELTPAQLKALRQAMRKADPEYADFIEQQKKDREARADAMLDSAEEEVRDFAVKELGVSVKNEKRISQFAKQVMQEILDDQKLLRQWQTGNLGCVKKACKSVQEYHEDLQKSAPGAKRQVEDKRRVSRLSTLPSASGSLSGEKRETREKGITKKTHEDAWAIFQGSAND